jgi:hypothetical protein
MSALKTETILIGGGLVVGAILLMKFLPALAKGAGGLVSGNNALTQGAKNADGSKQTAYQGAGVAGTLGAGANAASGGVFSTVGEFFGGIPQAVGDWWSPANPMTAAQKAAAAGPTQAAPPSTAAATDKYTQGGNASTGSGSLDYWNLSEPTGYGDQWGG